MATQILSVMFDILNFKSKDSFQELWNPQLLLWYISITYQNQVSDVSSYPDQLELNFLYLLIIQTFEINLTEFLIT